MSQQSLKKEPTFYLVRTMPKRFFSSNKPFILTDILYLQQIESYEKIPTAIECGECKPF